MDMLPYIFRSCRICGIWYKDSSYLFLKILYSGLIGLVIIYFLLSELIELMRMHNSFMETTKIIFTSFNFISCCIKILNIIRRHKDVENLLKTFRLPICQSQSPAEEAIISKYNGFHSKLFLGFCSLSLLTGLSLTVEPLLSGEFQLPFRSYQVFSISGPITFGVACSLQFLAIFYGILTSITLDSIAFSLIILATAQVEVNCHRIVNLTAPLERCIEHQILMCEFVYKTQKYFIPAVVSQFFFSLTTLCTSVFLLSQIPLSDGEFLSFALCFLSMLSQVFIYCWLGNELQLKNQELRDAIYTSNWIDCDKTKRKSLWFVMLYSNHATAISFHGQCTLTLNTFIWIVNTSYAAFNLLRTATK